MTKTLTKAAARMARRRHGRPVHGWIAFDKPVGMGSTQALAAGAAGGSTPRKAGHGGTLDPLASGILPIALGEATKTVQFAMDGRKIYRFTNPLGPIDRNRRRRRDSRSPRPLPGPTEQAILAALPAFIGNIMQVPRTYSAIQVDGKRAYDLARAGMAVVLEPRAVRASTG
jgi:tRNA pseudouridine55 synthase